MVGLFKRVAEAVKPKPLSPAAQALSDAWHEHVEFYPDDAAFELMAAAVLKAVQVPNHAALSDLEVS